MATNTLNSIHHHLRRGHSIDHHPRSNTTTTTTTAVSFSRKPIPTTATAATYAAAASSSATTYTAPSTSQAGTFDLLRHHLSTKNFREADEETRRLLIVLAGEAAVKRGYVFFSEVQFIAEYDLRTMDALWRQHSDNKFGYSVQKKVWEKASKDFTKFFIRVGWMKKLESPEVEQFNYRAFPAEFMWEMEEGTPEGHLPLTNALRGTQLLNSILTHPAFQGEENEQEEEGAGINDDKTTFKTMSKTSTTFKPNYTF